MINFTGGDHPRGKLFDDLMKGYNRNILPHRNTSDSLIVNAHVALSRFDALVRIDIEFF